MEFFQAILTAITTPNEGLIKILSFPLTFLDVYISMFFFSTILNISASKKQKLIYVLIYSAISFIINIFIPKQYAMFINIVIWPILIYFILKPTVIKAILSEVSVLVVTSILDTILVNVITLIFHITLDQILVIPIYRLATSLSIYLVVFLIALFIKYFKLNINIFDNINKKAKLYIIFNCILMLIILGMQFYLVMFYSDTMPLLITIITIIGIIAYFFTSVYSIMNSSKLEIAARDLEGAQLTIHSLQVLHDTVRSFKHDFDNIVNGIGGYVRNNDMEGLEKYYNDLLQDCRKTNNLYSLSPNVINQPAVYNILATKYYVADELNIQIGLDVFLDLNEIEKYMKIYEFTRILGILLDNAIEAASECTDKKIDVTFRKEDNKHRLAIIIENTYLDKEIDIDKIFEKGFSSKERNSGLGLWKVREILKRNNNLNLFTTKDSEIFKQQFEIYY